MEGDTIILELFRKIVAILGGMNAIKCSSEFQVSQPPHRHRTQLLTTTVGLGTEHFLNERKRSLYTYLGEPVFLIAD